MSTSSHKSLGGRRINSLQNADRASRKYSNPRRTGGFVAPYDAYLWALRVAFLVYLLQPRGKRLQHVAAPKPLPTAQRSGVSINELMKDISSLRDSKSTRLPHGFMAELDQRLTNVLIGKERRPEYADAAVKRTFAVFLNEFRDPKFRKGMEKDRRVEELVLIFFSNATKEMIKTKKSPEDESYKLMVDRHVALFLRLVSSTLRDHDWVRDRPDLSSKLQNMEKKLLMHDQDLAAESARNGASTGTTVEVEIPRSYLLKDMPMALAVSKIFEVPYGKVQDDINANKTTWTEQAALKDLKTYQASLSLNSKNTLSNEDFDTDEAFEQWKKVEVPDLSQMMLALIKSSPELAKSTGGSLPQNRSVGSDSGYSDASRKMSEQSETSTYGFDQPVDMSALNLNDNSQKGGTADAYTFIPPDTRAHYKAVLNQVIAYEVQNSRTAGELYGSAAPLFSPQSTELLNEVAFRWRIPHFSRLVLLLGVIRDKYNNQEVETDAVDAAFTYCKQPPAETKKTSTQQRGNSTLDQSSIWDRNRWTIADYVLFQQVLISLHETVLRELYEAMMESFGNKPPNIGALMYILENHIYDDQAFSKGPEELDQFSDQMRQGLLQKAREVYNDMLSKDIPENADQWEFYHVIQLGKAVAKLAQKIHKRYKKIPEVMGVNPAAILVEDMMPAFATDARDLVSRIINISRQRGEEVSIEDGFALYSELVAIRQVHAAVLPDQEFGFNIEDLLADFVWRWIATMDNLITDWVENAVKQDNFTVRTTQPGQIATDEQRHSVSVVDIFRSFNQTIEKIVQLEWDNDLQYAKFMTALSRSIGIGLARYCDLVEQAFTKEMDRITPEQEAQLKQSRQEKWVQYAKDALAAKEKMEPFQFLPESLVKLNDIEHSTLQLDKLEKEINVDACAEVINQHHPPRQFKPTTYVFTIKIIEAEDLKACDINGLSDPYVVLGDEYQKRLAKTRVVYSSLNPRWDETIDITTRGPLNLIATIWDWDTLGDHDCVGRTSLKLDPSHFSDFLPREYWLDLDTQGRLLLRVSMEGERDDIQFYFGKAFRTLKRTQRDMTRQITDKLSSYILSCLSERTLKSLTNRGISMSTVSSYFQRNLRTQSGGLQGPSQAPTQMEVMDALKPLFNYFDENFAIMKMTLTDAAMITVMTRLWKEVLATIESLLVPPLSDKPSQQRPLNQIEFDIVFKWLQLLFDFFHAVDEDSGVAAGVPLDILKSPKYHDLHNLAFFYNEDTDNLIRTSESMASATYSRQKEHQARQARLAPAMLNVPGSPMAFGGAAGLLGQPTRRTKTVMLSRNLGTMRKAKEEKRKEAQAEPNDDIILRILRMRPEAGRYLKDRSRQKEKLAAAAAAERIVTQSLASSGGGIGGRGR